VGADTEDAAGTLDTSVVDRVPSVRVPAVADGAEGAEGREAAAGLSQDTSTKTIVRGFSEIRDEDMRTEVGLKLKEDEMENGTTSERERTPENRKGKNRKME
jgi:hypothetical protein